MREHNLSPRNAMQTDLNAFDDSLIWFRYLSFPLPHLPSALLFSHPISVCRHVRTDVDFQFLFARSLLIIIPLVVASRGAAFSRCIFSDFFFHSLLDFKLAKCLTEIEESHAISRCPWKLSVFDWLPGARWAKGRGPRWNDLVDCRRADVAYA